MREGKGGGGASERVMEKGKKGARKEAKIGRASCRERV